jgi:hypothetical protein
VSSSRVDLQRAVFEALIDLGGAGTVPQIARRIWETYEADLRAAGDQFFTWQYEMRWAGQQLQKNGKLLKGGAGRQWILLT